MHRNSQDTTATALSGPPKKKLIMFQKQDGTCFVCSTSFQVQELQIHHIRPLCWSGTNDRKNLCLLCAECHGKAHGTDKERHPVLHTMFIKLGFDTERRGFYYFMYRTKASIKRRKKVVALATPEQPK